jgi:fatty acid desaturase
MRSRDDRGSCPDPDHEPAAARLGPTFAERIANNAAMHDGTPIHAAPARQPWRFAVRAAPVALPDVDLPAFAAEVRALRAELLADLGEADLAHLRRMQRWGRACSALGYATAWIAPNPLSALLIGLGNSARWTMLTHHVMHRGYDRVPGVPANLTSARFAQGWRRWIDWPDWILPAAWAHEHNQLHHFHTGELADPDLVEHNSWLLRLRGLPAPLRWLLIVLLMLSWKLSYYAPNTFWAWRQQLAARAARAPMQASGADRPAPAAETMADAWRLLYPGERLLLPLTPRAWHFWLRSALPYAIYRFGLLPALFLPLGSAAWAAVLINSILAELIANLHAFVIIVPNHAGDDVYRFDDHFSDRDQFVLRQVLGSVNYTSASTLTDFLQGHLNYQIEHHVWPDLPMLKYRQAAPRLKAICARHGVPYIEEPVWRRFVKLWAIMSGRSDMRRAAVGATPAAAPARAPEVEAAA